MLVALSKSLRWEQQAELYIFHRLDKSRNLDGRIVEPHWVFIGVNGTGMPV